MEFFRNMDRASDFGGSRAGGFKTKMSGPAIPEGELRARARQLMDKGDIPVLKVADIDGGYGRDHVCSVCGQQIRSYRPAISRCPESICSSTLGPIVSAA